LQYTIGEQAFGESDMKRAMNYFTKSVLKAECLTWDVMAEAVGALVAMHDVGGVKEEEGKKGSRTVINAVKHFQAFVRAK
jgi:hypothetical protein